MPWSPFPCGVLSRWRGQASDLGPTSFQLVGDDGRPYLFESTTRDQDSRDPNVISSSFDFSNIVDTWSLRGGPFYGADTVSSF
jgi:hypothetical protein